MRVRADWAVGGPVTTSELEELDRRQYAAVNGRRGGTWAPVNALVVGGSGIRISKFLGTTAGRLRFDNPATVKLGDWIRLGESHPDRRLVDLVPFSTGILTPMHEAQVYNLENPCGMMPMASSVNGVRSRIYVPFVPRRGKLKSVTVHFRVFDPNAATPTQYPRVRLVYVNADGGEWPITDWQTYVPSGEWASDEAKSITFACVDPPRASTTLTKDTTDSELVSVANAAPFVAGDIVTLGTEVYEVLAVSAGQLTLSRAVETTHNAGATIATVATRDTTTVDETVQYMLQVEPEVASDKRLAGSSDVKLDFVDRVIPPPSTALRESYYGGDVDVKVASVSDLMGLGTRPVSSLTTIEKSFPVQIDSEILLCTVQDYQTIRLYRWNGSQRHLPGAKVTFFGDRDLSVPNSASFVGNETVMFTGTLSQDGVWHVTSSGYTRSEAKYAEQDGRWYRLVSRTKQVPVASTLLADINATTTTVTITNEQGVTLPADRSSALTIDNERMLLTRVSGNVLTVVRGAHGTTASTHTAGALVALDDYLTRTTSTTFDFEEVTDSLPFGPLACWTHAAVEYEMSYYS